MFWEKSDFSEIWQRRNSHKQLNGASVNLDIACKETIMKEVKIVSDWRRTVSQTITIKESRRLNKGELLQCLDSEWAITKFICEWSQ